MKIKNEIDVIFFNVEAGLKPHVIKIDAENLEAFKTLIGCRTIDIVRRNLGGKKFCVVCDDKALLREDIPPLSIYSRDLFQRVYGNVIIACEKGDELASISNIDKVRVDISLGTLTTDITRYVLVSR